MAEDLEDELGRERETNQALLDRIREFTGRLDAERQEKSGKCACQISELYLCPSAL